MGELHEDITPDEYAAILSGPRLLGPKRLKSQHLLGGAKWEQQRDGSITVTHQIHVLYQLYTDESLSEVANKGHAHGDCAARVQGDRWCVEVGYCGAEAQLV